ncbi:hypothetical protein CQW23_14691 [Capsicum baccatum]|uniref:Uncharacterized protein n=1 Tax=Capsicum baccatum TaxID=33114 RepID=A0A2G2WJW4_CAPBA|nr:hypothetical protein CQW23_14691 [Capsicum baccatum]
MSRFKWLKKKQKLGPLVATSQGTESAPSFLEKTNLSSPIQHAPQPSQPVYSASHPAPIDKDTPHSSPKIFPESQLSPIDYLTSYPSLVCRDSSQLSPIGRDLSLPSPVVRSTSYSTPINQDSTQPALPDEAAPQKRSRRESNTHWVVDAIDSRNNVKKIKVKAKEVLNLIGDERIVIKFDVYEEPFGEARSLLLRFCGILACDCSLFPINFEKWSSLPMAYFNRVFEHIINI